MFPSICFAITDSKYLIFLVQLGFFYSQELYQFCFRFSVSWLDLCGFNFKNTELAGTDGRLIWLQVCVLRWLTFLNVWSPVLLPIRSRDLVKEKEKIKSALDASLLDEAKHPISSSRLNPENQFIGCCPFRKHDEHSLLYTLKPSDINMFLLNDKGSSKVKLIIK